MRKVSKWYIEIKDKKPLLIFCGSQFYQEKILEPESKDVVITNLGLLIVNQDNCGCQYYCPFNKIDRTRYSNQGSVSVDDSSNTSHFLCFVNDLILGVLNPDAFSIQSLLEKHNLTEKMKGIDFNMIMSLIEGKGI